MPSTGSTGRWRVAEPVALVALAVEALVGWPRPVYAAIGHPVGAFARLIDRGERRWNRPADAFTRRRLMGALLLVLVVIMTVAVAWLAQFIATRLLGKWGWIAVALLAFPGLAPRSLHDHVAPVARSLERGDLVGARTLVAMIVGRDTATLSRPGIVRATIESLAESFCDGVVAPLGWLLVAGLPGLWAYKAINTADSMIGHREERWRAFGWAAARVDDAANWLPARLAGVLICVAGQGGWRTMRRDAGKHASPNAGWPEAAMAGALGIALAGPIAYDGVAQDKPWLNREGRLAEVADLRRALCVYRIACGLLWLIAGGAAWLG